MGSPLVLQVASEPSARASAALVDRAWAAVVGEFEAVEQALSRFRPTSEIHQLRLAGGRAAAPSRRLVAALSVADRARRMTNGRFDPRVLGDLERLGSAPIELPVDVSAPVTAPLLGGLAGRPDPATPIVLRQGRAGPVEVSVPVDFGGIGKGLALRWAARRAATLLAGRPFLLEAGGDLVASGMPGRLGWRVAAEDPRPVATGEAPPVVVIELPESGGAIATSSIGRARWHAPGGRLVHHLIDPRTGEPGGEGLVAVTVMATDPAWSEVWSKSLFLEGRDGIAAVARQRDLAAWWLTADGDLGMTPRARQRTLWVAAEA